MSQRARVILIVSILAVVIIGGGIGIYFFSQQVGTAVSQSGTDSAGSRYLPNIVCDEFYQNAPQFEQAPGGSFDLTYNCYNTSDQDKDIIVEVDDLDMWAWNDGITCMDQDDATGAWPPAKTEAEVFAITPHTYGPSTSQCPIPTVPGSIQEGSGGQGTVTRTVPVTIPANSENNKVLITTQHIFPNCNYYQFDDIMVDANDQTQRGYMGYGVVRSSGDAGACGVISSPGNGQIDIRAWEETTGELPAAYSQSEGTANLDFSNLAVHIFIAGTRTEIDYTDCQNGGPAGALTGVTGGAGRESCSSIPFGSYDVELAGVDNTKYNGPLTAVNNPSGTNPLQNITIDANNPLAVVDFGYKLQGSPTSDLGNLQIRVFHDHNPANNAYDVGAGEGPPFSGQTMKVTQVSTGQDITSQCDSDSAGGAGRNLCRQIAVGDYEVEITPAPENTPQWTGPIAINDPSYSDPQNPGQNPFTITVTPALDPNDPNATFNTIDFGYTAAGTPTTQACLSGDVYYDNLDGNGQRQVGIVGYFEPGFNDVGITLKDSTGTVVNTVKTSNQGLNLGGLYDLGCVDPGSYTLEVDEATQVNLDGTNQPFTLSNLQRTGPNQTPEAFTLTAGQTLTHSFGYKDKIVGQGITCNLATTPDPASGPFPLDIAFDGSSSTGPITTYTFDFGDGTTPASGASATVNHTYAAAGNYTATLTVDDGAGGTESCNVPIEVIQPPISAEPICTIDKTVTDETPDDEESPDDPKKSVSSPGETLTFNITWNCKNVPPTLQPAAFRVYIVDDYDEVLTTLVPGSITPPGVDTNPPGIITWDLSGPAAVSGTVSFQTTVNGGLGSGTYVSPNFTSIVRAGQTTPDDEDQTETTIIIPPIVANGNPDIEVQKVVEDLNGGTLQPGDSMEYTIFVWNTGAVNTGNVTITDNVPPNVTNFNVTQIPTGATDNSQGPPAGSNATGLLSVTDFDLDPGETEIIRFQVDVAAGTPGGTVITNLVTASIDGDEATDDVSATVGNIAPTVTVVTVGGRQVPRQVVIPPAPGTTPTVGVSPQTWLLILSFVAAALVASLSYRMYRNKAVQR